jgi:hypothetical protein
MNGTGRRGRVHASLAALVAVALAALGALALVHPLQHLGFRGGGTLRSTVPVAVAGAFALLATGAPALAGPSESGGGDRTRLRRALGGAIPALAAGVAWPVFVAALFPAAVFLDAPARPLAALAALALAGTLVARPAWCGTVAVAALLGAGTAALLAVNVGLAGAVAVLVLLAAVGSFAARRAAAAGHPGDDRSTPTGLDGSISTLGGARGSAVSVAELLGPALLAAAAGFWAPAASVGLPLLALNLPAVGAVVGGAAGVLARVGLSRGGRTSGPALAAGGALMGYLTGALWTGMSVSAALG